MEQARKRRPMELNDALDMVGEIGPFQYTIFACLFVVGAFHGARMTSGYFFLFDQDHRCAVPTSLNDSIPPGDFCHIYYNTTRYSLSSTQNTSGGVDTSLIPCPNGWTYDTDIMKHTATSDFNLVCDRRMYTSHANLALMLGSLLGAMFFGKVSDRFGRKVCFHSSLLLFLATGIGMAWSSNFYLFAVLYAISGAASTGLFAAAIVTAMEFVKAGHRKIPGLLINIFFPVGECIMALVAFGLRDWRWISVTITAPAVVFISYYWIIPESIRWLMLNKKYEKLDEILRKMAIKNGSGLPNVDLNEERYADLLKSYEHEQREVPATRQRDSFWHMFKHWVLAQRVLFTNLNWLVVNLAFYGLVYNSSELGQGIFMNFFLAAIVEVPSHIISLLLVDRIGRKYIHCFYFLVVTAATGVSIIICLTMGDVKWVLLLMTMVGKFGAAGLLGTSFLWMTELYPTSVRSTGLGVGSACARIGAILSSYIIDFGQHMQLPLGNALPYIVFCATCAAAFIFCLFLPETCHRQLPETVEEARHFGRNPENAPIAVEQPHHYGANIYERL